MTIRPNDKDVPPWVAQLAASLDLDALTERVVEDDIEMVYPDRHGDQGFREALNASVRSNVSNLCEFLAGNITLDDSDASPPVEFARLQAQLNIPQLTLQRAYRVGTLSAWSEWTRLMHERAVELEISPEDETDAVRATTLAIFMYQDQALIRAASAYHEQEEAFRRSGDQVRQRLVAEILAGEKHFSAEDLYQPLAYEMSGVHLGIRITKISDRHAKDLASRLRQAAQAKTSLTASLRASETFIWISRPRTWAREVLDAVRTTLDESGVIASVSHLAEGLYGFRATHSSMEKVEEVRRAWTSGAPRVIWHEDVQIEALLLGNEDAAARFVQQALGSLAQETETAARLRDTLQASFVEGTHVSTARFLGVHEHTVRNRLQEAERLLGHSLTQHRVEVQVALRLHPLFRRS